MNNSMTNVMSFFSKCTNEKEPISFASKIGCKQALMFEMSRHVPVRIGKYAFFYHSINKLSLFLVCNLQSKKKNLLETLSNLCSCFSSISYSFLRSDNKKESQYMQEKCSLHDGKLLKQFEFYIMSMSWMIC